MPSIISASFWSYVLNWGQQGIAALVTFILAAVLGPEDYGLVVIAVSFILLIQSVLDQGFAIALIQRQDLTEEHLHTVFWSLIGLAILSTGIVLSGAHAWATWNHNADIDTIIWALTPLIFLKCMYLIPHVLLRREMNFRKIALITNIALIISSIGAIIALIFGLRVWALVLYYILSELALAIFYCGTTKYRPLFSFSFSKLMAIMPVATGGFVSGLGSFARSRGDIFIMGALLGPAAVGLFRLAMRVQELLLTLFMRPISMVALSALSKAGQDRASRQKSAAQFLELATGLTVPVMALAAALSPYLMGLLGEKWLPAAPALSILCVLGSMNAGLFLVPQFLNALGKSWQAALWLWATGGTALIFMIPAIKLLTATYAELPAQLSGLSLYLLAINVAISVPFGSILMRRNFALPWWFLAHKLIRPFATGLLVFGLVRIADLTLYSELGAPFHGTPLLFKLSMLSCFGGIILVAALYLFNRPFFDAVVLKFYRLAVNFLNRRNI